MLRHQQPDQRMPQLEIEREPPVAEIMMLDDGPPRCGPARHPPAPRPDHHELMIADKAQYVGHRLDPERHPDPSPDIFLETRNPGKALGAVDHLRKAELAPV